MSTKERESERDRRRRAQEAPTEIVADSAQPVAARKLDQMLSVRLDPDVVSDLRSLADELGKSLSDAMREAVVQWITSVRMRTATIEVFEIETGIGKSLLAGDVFGSAAKTFSNLAQIDSVVGAPVAQLEQR